MIAYETGQVTLLQGDVCEQLRTLTADSVQCCVTSPPYWGLRDYGVGGQLGRRAVGIDLNPEYLEIAKRRIGGQLSLGVCA